MDVDNRRAAVAKFLDDSSEEALDRYFDALGDEDWRVRKEAVRVGASVVSKLPFDRLIEGISQGDNVGLRNAGLQLLTMWGRNEPERLEAALAEVEPPIRKFVILALADSGVRGAMPVLIKALDDEDPHVAAAALDGVTAVGGAQAIEVLVSLLKRDDDFVRIAALHGLERLRAKVDADLVVPLLNVSVLRASALRALGRSGERDAAEQIVRFLGTDVPSAVVGAAAEALVGLRDSAPDGMAHVAEICHALEPDIRERLASLIDASEAPNVAITALLVMARDTRALPAVTRLHAMDRLGVRELLALREWQEAFDHLVAGADDSDGAFRASAMELAADIGVAMRVKGARGSRLRVEALSALQSEDVSLRLAGCRVLLHWGEPEDAPLLATAAERGPSELAFECAQVLDVLSERDPVAVRQSLRPLKLESPAGEALTQVMARVSVDDIVERLRGALSSQDASVRRSAVSSLALVRTGESLPLVELALVDDDSSVREEAVTVLGRLRDAHGEAVGLEILAKHQTSDDPMIRAAVARGLAEAGGDAGFEGLVELASDADPGVVVAAVAGLRSYSDPRSSAIFEKNLGHSDGDVVRNALMGLQECKSAALIGHLVDALDHPAWDVRRIAVELLGESGSEEVLEMLEQRGDVEDYDLVCDAIDVALSKLRAAVRR